MLFPPGNFLLTPIYSYHLFHKKIPAPNKVSGIFGMTFMGSDSSSASGGHPQAPGPPILQTTSGDSTHRGHI